MYIFEDNLKRYMAGEKLNNIVDKPFTFKGSKGKM